jgi:uncharacterized protein (DUF433 family)
MSMKHCAHYVFCKGGGEPFDSLQGLEDSPSRISRWRTYTRRNRPSSGGVTMSMAEIFRLAEHEVPTITVRKDLVGGKPCIEGTRIPVYMVLDAIEDYGNLEGVLESYPQLSMEQVKDAVRFSKLILECPVDNKIEAAS